jgi:RNA polymerase sigma factor (sigma-70 family)
MLYLANVAAITRMAEHACRRYHMRREEVEDFVQDVHLKIIANDYAVLRKFKEKCLLSTYLNLVIQRALQDRINHLWGKWRPSKRAERLGRVAVDLERLLYRDRLSLPEACQKLRAEGEVKETDLELADLAARLRPSQPGRRGAVLPDGGAGDPEGTAGSGPPERGPGPFGATIGGADERLVKAERAQRRNELLAALAAARAALPDMDQVIFRMFGDGFTVAAIARRLGLEQKPLYPRLQRIIAVLRQTLEQAGFSAAEVAELLDDPDDEPT